MDLVRPYVRPLVPPPLSTQFTTRQNRGKVSITSKASEPKILGVYRPEILVYTHKASLTP